jgi:hypothetical protein
VVVFAQAKRARDLTYRMLERTRRPTQVSDLYLIAGQLSGLMAGISFDLGHSDAAAEQARAALIYGQVIDHGTLRAWARATLSMIAFWSGRPSEGVVHAQAGLEDVTTGDTAIRLHAVAARSWALSGNREETFSALRAAEDVRSEGRDGDDLADGLGGEFVFGRERQELSAGAALLALDQHADAARHAEAAVGLFDQMLAEQRWTSGLHGARIDLATAHTLALDLDAATDALAATMALGPEHRTERVMVRMRALRQHVSAARYRGSLHASRFADEIEEFLLTGTPS